MRKRKSNGYWGPDNTLIEAKRLMEENNWDNLPCMNRLHKLGYGGLANAIKRNYTMHELRKLLNVAQKQVERNVRIDLEYTIREGRTIMEKYGFSELPSPGELGRLGYSGFVSSVYKYHGGFQKFRELFGERKQPRIRFGKFKDIKEALSYGLEIVRKYDLALFPSKHALRKLGESKFVGAVVRHHGYKYFRRVLNGRLGIPQEKNKLENVLDDYIGGKDE